MARAYAVAGTPVINLGQDGGGGGTSYTMDALDRIDQRDRADAAGAAQEFMDRVKPYANRPDLVKKMTDAFVAENPKAGKFLSAYQQDMPMTDDMQIGQTSSELVKGMIPMVVQALKEGKSVNPHILSIVRPYLAHGDKSMEPHEYDDLSQQYTYENQGAPPAPATSQDTGDGRDMGDVQSSPFQNVTPPPSGGGLPADYVTARKIKDKLQQSPQEIAQQGVERRGQDLTLSAEQDKANKSLQGTQYTADASSGASRYATDARKPVYQAEAGMMGSHAKLFDARAGALDTEHPTDPQLQQLTDHLKDLREQYRQTSIKARMSGNNAAAVQERAAAQDLSNSLTQRIHMAEQMIAGRRGALGMGNDEGNDAPDAAEPSAAPASAPPSTALPRPSAGPAPGSPPGAPSRRSAVTAPPGGIDPARKIITRTKLMELQAQKARGQAVDTSGWTVLDQ